MNLDRFRGTTAFGKAYQCMLENDTHAPGSVDREIVRGMVRLCPETVEHLYQGYTSLDIRYARGPRPALETVVTKCVSPDASIEEQVQSISDFTRGLGENVENDLRKMRFGGTEEQIMERGSDWCTDVARVACALYQVAGFPCRIVNLFDLDEAYSGHVVVEVRRSGTWGLVDSSSSVVYRQPDGTPATTWQLMNRPDLIESHQGPDAWHTNVEQFRAAGISNYFCRAIGTYDYTVTGPNDYCLSILSMARNQWPGGLRWLHDEDKR